MGYIILAHFGKKIFQFVYNALCLKVVHADIHNTHKGSKENSCKAYIKYDFCNDEISVRTLIHKINCCRDCKGGKQIEQHLKHNIGTSAAECVLVCQIGIVGNCRIKCLK